MAHLAEPEDKPFGDIIAEVVEELGARSEVARRVGSLLDEVTGELYARNTPPGAILLEALARMPQGLIAGPEDLKRRRGLEYEIREGRPTVALAYADGDGFILTPQETYAAVVQTNITLAVLEQFTRRMRVPLSELLGMRGMSVLVSAVVVSEVEAICSDKLFANPHQDGYPDLLPRTLEALAYCEAVRDSGRWSDKTAWTDVGFGGVEVKATNGNTPSAKRVPKKGIGEERSTIISGFDWKAHHRETSKLLGNIWDFVDGVPTVSASFWRNDLTVDDWGGIVSPRAGGGRTTSVSIMNRDGLNKMAAGWMVRTKDPALRGALMKGRMLAATGSE